MSTQEAMEIWEQQLRDEGLERGLERGLTAARHGLLRFYETRFGEPSPAVRARLESMSDPDTITAWYDRIAQDTREVVDRDLSAR